jgi:hypothetical protein
MSERAAPYIKYMLAAAELMCSKLELTAAMQLLMVIGSGL